MIPISSEAVMSGLEHRDASFQPTDEGLRLARLCRMGHDGLDDSQRTVEELQELLRSVDGWDETSSDVSTDEIGACERHVIQLASDVAGWAMIEPWAERLVRARLDENTASIIVDAAARNGTGRDIERAIAMVVGAGSGFWTRLDARSRARSLATLWREGRLGHLNTIIHATVDAGRAEPLEYLYVFLSLAQSGANEAAWEFLLHNEKRLRRAVTNHGTLIGLSMERFLLAATRLAITHGDADMAHKFVERVPKNAPEYQEALEALLQLSRGAIESSDDRWVREIMEESDGERRVDLMTRYIAIMRRQGGLKTRSRPFLNRLLEDTSTWLPADPAAWSRFSSLVASNLDLITELPGLDHLMRQNALSFHFAVIDTSLWSGPVGIESTRSAGERYWRGVARLHDFVNGGCRRHDRLWSARADVLASERETHGRVPFRWGALLDAVSAHLVAMPSLTPGYAAEARNAVACARSDGDIDPARVLHYVDATRRSGNLSAETLDILIDVMDRRRQYASAIALTHHRRSAAGYPDRVLSDMWQWAIASNAHDLAWRAATVLASRQSLDDAVRFAWETSGERPDRARFMAVDRALTERCLTGDNPAADELLRALLTIGPAIADLLGMTEAGARPWKPIFPAAHPLRALESHLDSLGWLPAGGTRWRFAGQLDHPDMLVRPPFMTSIPAGSFTLTLAVLADRLGLHAWNWDIEWLRSTLSARLGPFLHAEEVDIPVSGPFHVPARWLASRVPEERHALTTLMTGGLDTNAFAWHAAAFLIRVAATITADHHGALNELRVARAPLGLIRDLETWTLSDACGDLRDTLGSARIVPVPNALRRLTVIHR